MKFALHFANNNFPDGAGAKRIATAAEAAGFGPTRYEAAHDETLVGADLRHPGEQIQHQQRASYGEETAPHG